MNPNAAPHVALRELELGGDVRGVRLIAVDVGGKNQGAYLCVAGTGCIKVDL